jgi:hypothetical protein
MTNRVRCTSTVHYMGFVLVFVILPIVLGGSIVEKSIKKVIMIIFLEYKCLYLIRNVNSKKEKFSTKIV